MSQSAGNHENHEREVRFTAILTPDLKAELEQVAREEDRSEGAVVRRALAEYFERRREPVPA